MIFSMAELKRVNAETIRVVAYDPNWPVLYLAERANLLAFSSSGIVAIEHIGSTAIPGLSAKPIIDIMAAMTDLEVGFALMARLAPLG